MEKEKSLGNTIESFSIAGSMIAGMAAAAVIGLF